MHISRKLFLAAIASSVVAFAQNPITADSPYQVRYAGPTTATGQAVVNIVNTGATGVSVYGPGFGTQDGNICVNVYTLDPGEELVSCCSCYVTPDALVSLDVYGSLLSNTETAALQTSGVVIKLVATAAGGAGGTGAPSSCNNSAATIDSATLATGLAAWGTTTHTGAITSVTETAFTPSTLSGQEVASLAGRCRSFVGNASSAGICKGCAAGGLGAAKTKL